MDDPWSSLFFSPKRSRGVAVLPGHMMGMQAAAPSFAEAGAYHLPPRDIVFPSAAVADPGQSAALPVDLLVRAEHFSTFAQQLANGVNAHCARMTLWPGVLRSVTT